MTKGPQYLYFIGKIIMTKFKMAKGGGLPVGTFRQGNKMAEGGATCRYF
jgi:hypothetical protein